MSRSGYSDDINNWDLIRWRGAVTSAMRGRRGQAFLRELLAALDAMPDKRLIRNNFAESGAYCTLGVIGAARGTELPQLDQNDDDYFEGGPTVSVVIAERLNIPRAMAAEIMFENDDGCGYWLKETPEQRWTRMRNWINAQLKEESEK